MTPLQEKYWNDEMKPFVADLSRNKAEMTAAYEALDQLNHERVALQGAMSEKQVELVVLFSTAEATHDELCGGDDLATQLSKEDGTDGLRADAEREER